MPRTPKPQRLRQNTERRDYGLVPLDGRYTAVPPAPRNWLAASRNTWDAYWTSPLAHTVVPDTDLPIITRLFALRDERERMARVIRRHRVVPGSQGQPRANPLYAQVSAFDAEIRQLEDRLGLSPIARLRLGVTFGDAMRSLADLNRDLDHDDDAASPDLRLTITGGPPTNPRTRGRAVDGAEPRPRTG